MKKRNQLLAAALTGALSLSLLAGCSSSAQQGGAAASGETSGSSTAASAAAASGEEDNVIRIGVIGPMTGGNAIYGEGAQNAVDMAVEEINSSGGPYTIEIVNGGELADDAQDARQAMNAYNLVMADDPEALVGSFFSSVTLPIAQQASVDNMLLVATGATNVDVTVDRPTVFRDCFIDPYQGKMAAMFVQSEGYTKVAVLYANDDDYSNGLKDAFIENCEANGIEVVYEGRSRGAWGRAWWWECGRPGLPPAGKYSEPKRINHPPSVPAPQWTGARSIFRRPRWHYPADWPAGPLSRPGQRGGRTDR